MGDLSAGVINWFLNVMPVYNGGVVSALEPWAGLVAWTGVFIDYAYVGGVVNMLIVAEAAINVSLFFIRIWELVPGM